MWGSRAGERPLDTPGLRLHPTDGFPGPGVRYELGDLGHEAAQNKGRVLSRGGCSDVTEIPRWYWRGGTHVGSQWLSLLVTLSVQSNDHLSDLLACCVAGT